MMWKRRGEADGSWIGPLRVMLQEGPHVVWITMGHKLFRVAPEHLRPLSAVEDWKQQQMAVSEEQPSNPSDSLQSIIPPHGGIQYHSFIQNSPNHNNGSHSNLYPKFFAINYPRKIS